MRTTNTLALALAAALAAAPVLAADPPRGGPPPGGVHGDGEMRERIQQKVQTYLTVELSTRLGLDQAKSMKLSESIKSLMQKRQVNRQRLREEAQKLRALVNNKASDADVKKQLDVVIGAAGRDDMIHDFVQETGKYLTATEQAKLALAMPEVMRDMKRMMRDARGKRGGGVGGGFGGPDVDDDL
jgi:hypothetical protein